MLLPDFVRPFARSVLGRLDLLASLAAQDADEAAHYVRLPTMTLVGVLSSLIGSYLQKPFLALATEIRDRQGMGVC